VLGMKNILTIIAFLAFWIPAYGQVAYESIDLKTDNNYQYISTYSSSARKKYTNAIKWLESSINDFDETIVTDDAQAFKVVFKPEIQYEQTDTKTHYLVANISVECRDDKFRIRLTDIQRKTVTKTCNYLTAPNRIYKTHDYNVNEEMKQFDRYKKLSAKRPLTSEEAKALRDLKKFAKMKRNDIIEKEMKPYTDLQKAIAKFIEDIETEIKK
jgi:hypothetical protein